MKKQLKSHCRIGMNVTNLKTGEQRELSQQEIAERMQGILSLPPAERIKMSSVKRADDAE